MYLVSEKSIKEKTKNKIGRLRRDRRKQQPCPPVMLPRSSCSLTSVRFPSVMHRSAYVRHILP